MAAAELEAQAAVQVAAVTLLAGGAEGVAMSGVVAVAEVVATGPTADPATLWSGYGGTVPPCAPVVPVQGWI